MTGGREGPSAAGVSQSDSDPPRCRTATSFWSTCPRSYTLRTGAGTVLYQLAHHHHHRGQDGRVGTVNPTMDIFGKRFHGNSVGTI